MRREAWGGQRHRDQIYALHGEKNTWACHFIIPNMMSCRLGRRRDGQQQTTCFLAYMCRCFKWLEIDRERDIVCTCAAYTVRVRERERERERGSVMNSLCVCVCVIVHVWIRRREREKEWPYLIVLSIRNTFLAKQIWLETLTEITDSVASVLFSNAFFSNKIIDRRRKPKDESECLS